MAARVATFALLVAGWWGGEAEGFGRQGCQQMSCYSSLNNAPNARWKGSKGNTKFLGTFDSVSACEAACVGYSDKKGNQCQSFVYHDPELSPKCMTKRKCFDSQCFAILDDTWNPVAQEHVISGKIGFSASSMLNKIAGGVAGTESQTEKAKESPKAKEAPKPKPAEPKKIEQPKPVELPKKKVEPKKAKKGQKEESKGLLNLQVAAQAAITAAVIIMSIGAFVLSNRRFSGATQKSAEQKQLFKELSAQGKVDSQGAWLL